MNMQVCRDDTSNPACAPRQPYNELDHYFYFANVRQCGQGTWRENREANAQFIASQNGTCVTFFIILSHTLRSQVYLILTFICLLYDHSARIITPTLSTLDNATAAATSTSSSAIARPTAITNSTQGIFEALSGLSGFLASYVNGAARQ
jgi:hypothetical protein